MGYRRLPGVNEASTSYSLLNDRGMQYEGPENIAHPRWKCSGCAPVCNADKKQNNYRRFLFESRQTAEEHCRAGQSKLRQRRRIAGRANMLYGHSSVVRK